MSRLRVGGVVLFFVVVLVWCVACDEQPANADDRVAQWKDANARQERQSANCPNSCGSYYGRGHCNSNGRCSCYDNWGGEDCSIPVKPLNTNTKAISTVQANAWQYWMTDTSHLGTHGQTITWTVSSTLGDCDLYVQSGHTPTRQDNYRKETSTAKYFTLQITNVNSGRWYAGIYGFGSQCNYSITVAVTGGSHTSCPNDCSNRGSCSAGTCYCQGGWAGADCSIQVHQVTMGVPFTDTVYGGVWHFYSVPVSFSVLDIYLNLTGTNTYKPDVYVKFGALPNQTYYDDRDSSFINNSIKMEVAAPRGARIAYIGVLALYRTYFSFLVTEYNSCPSKCSNHGQCDMWGNTCRCTSQFSGSSCEYMNTPLSNNQPVQGYVSDNNWNYYHFTATTIHPITVTVDQMDNDPTDDCDLYVRAGAYPTLWGYDYADYAFSSHMSITIRQPQFNTWYIGVYGKKHCTYQVRQAVTSACGECNHGQCTPKNTCHCYPGWAGPACSIQVVPLGVGQTAQGTLNRNQWSYYSFNATGSVATVSLLEVEPWAKGYYWLFVGLQQVPNLDHADYANKETNTGYHEIDMSLSAPTTIYVGVYGSPFDLAGISHPPAHYQLSVWQSPF